MPLTDTAIRNMKPSEKAAKYSDGGGLYLYVSPSGGKLWRMDYRYEGKRKTMSFGAYPAISLKGARQLRDEAKEILAKGLDPQAQKKQEHAEIVAAQEASSRTFRVVADEWFAIKKEAFSASHIKKKSWVIDLLCKHLADIPIANVTPLDILAAIKPVDNAGKNVTAHKMAGTAAQICRYARTCGYIVFNPADKLTEALKPIKSKHYSCITDKKSLGFLLRSIDEYEGHLSVVYALRILPYLALRSTELRGARWEEINFDEALWIVPATRSERPQDGGGMKMRIAHQVPLPTQVVTLFKELKTLSESGPLCFPSRQSKTRCISDMSLLNAIRRMGFGKDEMTIHGFRATFSTMMNELKSEWGIDRDIIEHQLAHKDRNAVRAAYNHAEYLPERRKMLQKWADFLDELKVSA